MISFALKFKRFNIKVDVVFKGGSVASADFNTLPYFVNPCPINSVWLITFFSKSGIKYIKVFRDKYILINKSLCDHTSFRINIGDFSYFFLTFPISLYYKIVTIRLIIYSTPVNVT